MPAEEIWVAAEHLAIYLSMCLRMLDDPRIDICLGAEISWLSCLITLICEDM